MDLAAFRGVLRSLALYRLRPGHHAGLVGLYRPFVRPGGLVFDIGAHVGDRTRAFRALGAEVVAVEPQHAPLSALRLLHGRDPGIAIVAAALGACEGEADLRVNARNPSVSTVSAGFLSAIAGAPGWQAQLWDRIERVRVTTLDRLAAGHGVPDFVKIDVEGHEAEVLAGLSAARAPAALSFEVVAAARDAGLAALDRAAALGYRRFRLSVGETHRFAGGWLDVTGMRRGLLGLPASVNSGDVYAVRDGHPALLPDASGPGAPARFASSGAGQRSASHPDRHSRSAPLAGQRALRFGWPGATGPRNAGEILERYVSEEHCRGATCPGNPDRAPGARAWQRFERDTMFRPLITGSVLPQHPTASEGAA